MAKDAPRMARSCSPLETPSRARPRPQYVSAGSLRSCQAWTLELTEQTAPWLLRIHSCFTWHFLSQWSDHISFIYWYFSFVKWIYQSYVVFYWAVEFPTPKKAIMTLLTKDYNLDSLQTDSLQSFLHKAGHAPSHLLWYLEILLTIAK